MKMKYTMATIVMTCVVALTTSRAQDPANPPSEASGTATVHEVAIKNIKLHPDDITIKMNDTIRWTNNDDTRHNLASIPGSGPYVGKHRETDDLEIFSLMEPSFVFTHTFTAPGQYPYFCFIHNQMTGHITVVE